METLVKRVLPAPGPNRSGKAIERYAQAYEVKIEEVLSRRQKRKSQRAAAPINELIAAATGRLSIASPLALRVFQLARQVESFRTLPPNWDTYDALPTQEPAIRRARQLLDLLAWQLTNARSVSIHVFPMRDGGVQIEVDREDAEMEIEVHPDGTEDYLVFNGEGKLLPVKNTLTQALRPFASRTPLLQIG